MPGFQTTAKIRLPPQVVFEYITNLDNTPQWLPGVMSVEKLTEGPVSVGTRYRETRQAIGREVQGHVEMEVTRFDPPRRFATSFDQGGYETTYSYSLARDGLGTKVTLECEVEGRGWKSLLAPLAAKAMQRFDKGLLKSLKSAMEGKRR